MENTSLFNLQKISEVIIQNTQYGHSILYALAMLLFFFGYSTFKGNNISVIHCIQMFISALATFLALYALGYSIYPPINLPVQIQSYIATGAVALGALNIYIIITLFTGNYGRIMNQVITILFVQ